MTNQEIIAKMFEQNSDLSKVLSERLVALQATQPKDRKEQPVKPMPCSGYNTYTASVSTLSIVV